MEQQAKNNEIQETVNEIYIQMGKQLDSLNDIKNR